MNSGENLGETDKVRGDWNVPVCKLGRWSKDTDGAQSLRETGLGRLPQVTLVLEPPRQVNDVIMKALHSNEVSSKPGMSPRLEKVGMGKGGVGMNSCSRPRVRSQAGCLPWAVGKSDWWCQGLAGRSCPQHVGIHNATAVCHGGCRCTGVKEKPC